MKKRSLIALLTAASMVVSMSPAAYAEAEVSAPVDYPMGEYNLKLPEMICESDDSFNKELTLTPHQTYSNFGTNTYNYYDCLSTLEKKCYDEILSALESNPGATECTVYTNDWDAACKAYWAVINDNPEYIALFAIRGWVYSDRCELTFTLCDDYTETTAKSAYEQVMSKVNNIVAGAESYSTNYEKLKYFAHYLCDNVTYNHNAAQTGEGDDCWNAYGALINGSGVCESYAEAFKLLCDAIHVPCITVISSNHKWNQVYMAGNWYIVDVTWMDSYEITGYYYDDWFMIGSRSAAALDSTVAHQISYFSDLTHPLPIATDYSVSLGEEVYDEAAKDQMILDFTERLYVTMLNRASDPSGKAHWFELLKNGTTAAEVASRFVLSEEIKSSKLSNQEFVTRMYRTFLDREPDASGFAHWIGILEKGCSYAYILNRFAVSAEFSGICESYGITPGSYKSTEYRDASVNLTAFISRMYTKALNRTYDVDGLNHWTESYITGVLELDDIARKFIFSAEFVGRNLSDEQFVTCMYSTFFDRAPDEGGYSHWMNVLASGGTREDVLAGFLRAAEYDNLVDSFGLN